MRMRLNPEHFRRRYRQYRPNPLPSSRSSRRALFFRPWPNFTRPLKRLAFIFLILGALVFGMYSVFFSGYFTIQTIEVIENGERAIDSPLRNRFDEFIGRNLLFVRIREPLQELRQAHMHEFETLTVERNFPHAIRIRANAFRPSANITTTQKNILKKFIINSEGLITKEDAEDPNLPYIRYLGEEEIGVGAFLIPAERLANTVLAVETFTDRFGMKVVEVLYYPVEREIHLKTEQKFILLLDVEQPIVPQLTKLKRALGSLDIYHEEFEYIDLRIAGSSGDKVIFKRR